MTELFINIGQFDEAKRLLTDAESMLFDFQDPAIVIPSIKSEGTTREIYCRASLAGIIPFNI